MNTQSLIGWAWHRRRADDAHRAPARSLPRIRPHRRPDEGPLHSDRPGKTQPGDGATDNERGQRERTGSPSTPCSSSASVNINGHVLFRLTTAACCSSYCSACSASEESPLHINGHVLAAPEKKIRVSKTGRHHVQSQVNRKVNPSAVPVEHQQQHGLLLQKCTRQTCGQ